MVLGKKKLETDTSELLVRRGLARLGYEPEVIIDVGVRKGTPWLYESFPDAFFILVDPQKGGASLLESAPANYTFINKALGSKAAIMTLQDQGAMSTLLQRTRLTAAKSAGTYEVDVVTLDRLVDEQARNKRCGLKLDTEGFEVEIMCGLEEYVDHFDFVLAEVSVLNRFENSYNFSELVALFYDKGFRFYNFFNQPKPVPSRFYDCLFLRKNDSRFDTDF
jgi:FkbM family methyltransferase